MILHALCGQLLEVHPTYKVNKCWRLLVSLIELLLTLCAVFCLITAGYTIFTQRKEFKFAIFVAAGFLGIFECLFRVVYTSVRRHKIENIFERMQAALNFSILGTDKKPFARKISRFVNIEIYAIGEVIYLHSKINKYDFHFAKLQMFFFQKPNNNVIFSYDFREISFFSVALFGIFAAAMITNYIATVGQLGTILEKSNNGGGKFEANKLLENQLSMDTLEAWTYVCHFFKLWPSITLLKIYTAVFYVFNFLAIGRIIVSDVLFYSWYFIVLDQYQELSMSLKETLRETASGTKLKIWIEHHHHVNE